MTPRVRTSLTAKRTATSAFGSLEAPLRLAVISASSSPVRRLARSVCSDKQYWHPFSSATASAIRAGVWAPSVPSSSAGSRPRYPRSAAGLTESNRTILGTRPNRSAAARSISREASGASSIAGVGSLDMDDLLGEEIHGAFHQSAELTKIGMHPSKI